MKYVFSISNVCVLLHFLISAIKNVSLSENTDEPIMSISALSHENCNINSSIILKGINSIYIFRNRILFE